MPIRPENKDRYPKDWPAISRSIRERACGVCECTGECGVGHIVTPAGEQVDSPQMVTMSMRCSAANGEPHPVTGAKVVLTVAHLDHAPENCDPENLRAWCQGCHNRYNAPMRRKGIQERARAKRADGDLFEARRDR